MVRLEPMDNAGNRTVGKDVMNAYIPNALFLVINLTVVPQNAECTNSEGSGN